MDEIGTPRWQQLIFKAAQSEGIELNDRQLSQFSIHAEILLAWNRKINLTRITRPKEVAIKHFVDSILAGQLIPTGAALLDIGSGGGFPGIPLKITWPQLSVTLLEASRKKVSFLSHIIHTLKLNEIRAHHVRAEDVATSPEFRGHFDVVISRALGSLESFVGMALPLTKPQGTIIAMKGRTTAHEMDRIRPLIEKEHLHLQTRAYCLPCLNDRRTLVWFKRVL